MSTLDCWFNWIPNDAAAKLCSKPDNVGLNRSRVAFLFRALGFRDVEDTVDPGRRRTLDRRRPQAGVETHPARLRIFQALAFGPRAPRI